MEADQPMPSVPACASSAVPEGGRLVLDLSGTALPGQTIGIFRVRGRLFAYQNQCPHQGGPVCQGTLLPRVTETATGPQFDPNDPHIVCPWHGFEFSIETGQHAASTSYTLTAIPVEEEGGQIHVNI